eukprot:scaffold120669_cov57-Phaeocystis_antarctica.AAC.3
MVNACRLLVWLMLLPGAAAQLDSSSAALEASTVTVPINGDLANGWSGCCGLADQTGKSVTVGDKLSFGYNAAHNVWLMESAAKYASCDFSGATELASTSKGGGSGGGNLYQAVVTGAGTLYIACKIGAHCSSAGQKVTIIATAAPTPPPPSPP